MPLLPYAGRLASRATAALAVYRLTGHLDGPAPDPSDDSVWLPAEAVHGQFRPEVGEQSFRSPAVGERLRVVTYNVQGARDVGRLAGAIAENDAVGAGDVYLLQEIDDDPREGASRARRLAERLGLNYAYAPARMIGRRRHGIAVLSRMLLEDVRVMELKRLTTRFRLQRRVALAATARAGTRRLRLFNVHLDPTVNPWRRKEQIEAVAAAAAACDEPCVLGGDVNTNPALWFARWMPVFLADQPRYLDRYIRGMGLQTPVTGCGATHWLGTRLDTFYTRGLETGEFGVERDVRASDHFPLWMDVALGISGRRH